MYFSSVSSNLSNKSNSNQNNRVPFSRNNSTETSNGPGNRFNSGNNTGAGSRFNSGTGNGGSASRFSRRDSSANNPPKRELGPVREGRFNKKNSLSLERELHAIMIYQRNIQKKHELSVDYFKQNTCNSSTPEKHI